MALLSEDDREQRGGSGVGEQDPAAVDHAVSAGRKHDVAHARAHRRDPIRQPLENAV